MPKSGTAHVKAERLEGLYLTTVTRFLHVSAATHQTAAQRRARQDTTASKKSWPFSWP